MASNAVIALDLARDRARALELVPVSRETATKLDDFISCLLKWQRKMNLIAPSTVGQLWTRHVADSLQLLQLAPTARKWIDLGSGGGFPGLVIAAALAGREGSVDLVESNAKKAAFLRETARQLQLPALVHAVRIEDFVSQYADSPEIVTARALAPLAGLLGYVEPLMKKGAQALFPKGQDVEAELTTASKYWKIEARLAPSLTDARSRIVVVEAAERR
jgi:16S rRNA (guanine527-N7)-methyltransferase